MTEAEIEQSNKYNAKHYEPFEENEDIEFYFEPECFEEWLENTDSKRGKHRGKKTVKTTLDRIKRYFAAMGVLSEENVKLYRQGMQDADNAPAFINLNIVAVKSYIKFLSEKYNAPRLVGFKANTIKIQQKQFIDNVISRADYDFLISETRKDKKHPNAYLCIRIMGTTGVRRCELLQVKVEHIKHGYIDVIGKGGKQRRIYFPKNAREELLQYLSELGVDSGYVIRRWGKTNKDTFTANTRDKGDLKELTNFERSINTELSRVGERYGIAPELMHPHGFRHFFAKEFLRHRLDISLLADLLGHSSLEITRIYLKMTSKEQAEVVDETVTW